MNARDKSILMRGRRPLVAALAAAASCSAWAEDPSPYYIGVTQALTRDSNVYRLNDGVPDPDGLSRGDTYSSTGLVGGFDQSIGRQRFYAAANLKYNKYQDHDKLDNTSYGLNAGWDWSSIWNLSGGVNVSANQNLAQFNGNTAAPVQTTGRNLVKTDQIGANIAWGGTGLLSVQSSYAHSRVRYSQSTSLNSDSSADTGSLGAYYNISPDVTTGIALRLTRTDSPNAVLNGGSSSSDSRNVDLSVNWRYTVQTGVNARLSWTRQTNSGGGGQEFSGLTGAVSANYAPTGKLAFSLAYSRDAGTNGNFFNVPATSNGQGGTTVPTTLLTENSQVTDSLTFGATYAATAKISVNAGYSYRKARVSNGGIADYDDKLKSATLGASWAIARAWQLGCNLSHETRDANSTPALTYSANTVGCSAQFTFR